MANKVNLIFIPLLSPGHAVSILETAKRILKIPQNPFTITVLMMQPLSSNSTIPTTLPSTEGLDIHFHELPAVQRPASFDSIEDYVSQYVESYKPHIKEALVELSSSVPIVGVILDFFATTVNDVLNELNIPSYIFFPTSALMLSLMLHLPILHEKIPGEFIELDCDIDLPGAYNSLPPLSLPSSVINKKNKAYTWFVYHGRRMMESKGIIVNTFFELEKRALKAIEDSECVPEQKPPAIYPIGPVITLDKGSQDSDVEQHHCIKWLNEQPHDSVVFLCFGSLGGFEIPQIREMAAGLEQCGHRFLWCLRIGSLAKIQIPIDANLDEVLPEGFLERTRNRGLVWPSWAPQKEILAHKAVRGFVSHCGWNSTLESLWFGVPILGWPLYAEQHLNVFELVKELGVGMELKVDRMNGNYVRAEELEKGIRCIMGDCEEGKRVRAKAEEMKICSRNALEKEGSSSVNLERLVMDLSEKL